MACSLDFERELHRQGINRVVGIDEAGRGPLAGPVLVAGVILPTDFSIKGLDDSKKLIHAKRELLYEQLTSAADVVWSCIRIEATEIDRLNILGATHHGMREVAFRTAAVHALIDGLPVPDFPIPHTALVGGDGRSLSIAAASVIAKVERDRMMDEAAERYPEYAFERHKGYPTALHLERLKKHGPCPIHRRSFGPVAQLTLF